MGGLIGSWIEKKISRVLLELIEYKLLRKVNSISWILNFFLIFLRYKSLHIFPLFEILLRVRLVKKNAKSFTWSKWLHVFCLLTIQSLSHQHLIHSSKHANTPQVHSESPIIIILFFLDDFDVSIVLSCLGPLCLSGPLETFTTSPP